MKITDFVASKPKLGVNSRDGYDSVYTKAILEDGVHVWTFEITSYAAGYSYGATPLELVHEKLEDHPIYNVYSNISGLTANMDGNFSNPVIF